MLISIFKCFASVTVFVSRGIKLGFIRPISRDPQHTNIHTPTLFTQSESKVWYRSTSFLLVQHIPCMVPILNSNSVRCNLGYLICVRHLFRSRAVTNLIFVLQKRPVFLQACATYSELPSNTSAMIISSLLVKDPVEIAVYKVAKYGNQN